MKTKKIAVLLLVAFLFATPAYAKSGACCPVNSKKGAEAEKSNAAHNATTAQSQTNVTVQAATTQGVATEEIEEY